MPFDLIFRAANGLALLCWVALILLPRWRSTRRAIQLFVMGGLCLAYSTLVLVYFFRVEGGGFDTLAAVQRLFTSPPIALAGWLHYLAFDLFVGLWIAARADGLGLSRWVQAPILLAAFMFGPLGLLLHTAVEASARVRRAREALP